MPRRIFWRTRLFALAALATVAASLFLGARAAYFAYHDRFVAPIVLSPESDTVIQAKLSLLRLEAERRALEARVQENKGSLKAAEDGIAALTRLGHAIEQRLAWSRTMTSRNSYASDLDARALDRQKEILRDTMESQRNYVAELRKDVAAGLVRKSDLEREEMELGRLEVTSLQKEREASSTDLQRFQHRITQRALRRGPSRVLPPEILSAQEQSVRIAIEIQKLEAERQSKTAQLRAGKEDLVRLDDMVAQMKERPIFRAIATEQNVAFVPYSQLEGVARGAPVLKCALWGIFFCTKVGTVSEVLKGEVVLQDPSGGPARGQYAILQLMEGAAAREKLLRVRPEHDRAQTPSFSINSATGSGGAAP